MNTGGVEHSFGGVRLRGAVLIKRDGDRLQVIPCGDLGGWNQAPTEGFEFWQDRTWPEPPADRGCGPISLDLSALIPGSEAGHTSVAGRDQAGQPADVQWEREGSLLTLTPAARWLDCTVGG